MSNDTFGLVPLVKRIPLTTDADWVFAMRLSEDWPDGITLTFEVEPDLEWEATIDGQWARFFTDKAVTNDVTAGTRWKFFARLDDVEECWYLGTVLRFDGEDA